MERRKFIKGGVAVAAGILAGELGVPVKVKINQAVNEITKRPTGNAAVRKDIETVCKDTLDFNACSKNYSVSTAEKIAAVTSSPLIEEFLCRALPAKMVSEMDGRASPVLDVLNGTGGFGMSRREIGVGVIGSLFFGLLHNVTWSGIDTKTIPASQTLGGLIYWYLQRKFGFIANTTAHITNNFKALW